MSLPKLLARLRAWLDSAPLPPQQAAPSEPSFLEELIRPDPMGTEKRASVRRSVHARAELVDSFSGLPFSVAVENLSDHGVYFTSDTGLRIGSAVEATLEIPAGLDDKSRHVQLHGRVVRVEPRADGVFGIAAQIMRRRTLS